MSLIYSITTYLTRNIEDLLRKSLLFTVIYKILFFIENCWVNSYFKQFYPGENFLSFIKRSKILSEHIFAPLIVIVIFAIFLLLATQPLNSSLQNTVLIGFVFFIIGSMILPRFILNNKEENIPIFNSKDIHSIGFCLIIIGLIFFFISIASVGGLPILKSSLRYSLKPIFTMPVFLLIPGIGLVGADYLTQFKNKKITRSQVRFRFILLLAFGAIILLTLGYRTPIIAVLLMIIIIGYYGKILSVWEVIIGALIGVCGIIGIGYFRSLNELIITSNTSPIYSLQTRADFTLHVLNLLNQISGNFGILHGGMISGAIPGSPLGPRMIVGKLIAWRTEVTVTPTLLGQMLIDFGKVGVAIEMLLLGFILGTGYKIIKITKNSFYIVLYSLLLTYTILGVETGILDIQVLFYFFIAIFIYLAVILKNKGIKIY